MRIGYECMLTGPQDTGVGVSIRELLHALLATPGDDTLVLYTHAQAAEDLPIDRRIATVRCALPARGKAARIAWQQTGLQAQLRRAPVDLYHGPGYIVPPRLPVPSVVSVYDTIALERPALTTRANALHYRWAVPRAVRAARYIIVPSEYVRRRLLALTDAHARNTVVIPLGVSDEFRPLEPEETTQRLREAGLDDQPFLLCVGNIERKKNFLAALHALVGAQSRLVFAGPPGNATPELRRRVGALGLDGAVVHLGYVPRHTLVALYNRATALLYPSYEEGFGLPVLEAMACGAPVAASNAGAIPETAGGAALLLDPGDYGEWERAAARIASEAGLREELRGRGFRRAACFSWQRTAADVLDIYHKAYSGE